MKPAEQRHYLETSQPFYAEHCLKIVDQNGQLVALVAKPAQIRVDAALERQRAAGRPMRVIVPKARKEGVSTWVEGRMVRNTTLHANHKALVVAHNKKTTGEIFEMATTMIAMLPNETIDGLCLKPPIASSQRRSEVSFGTRERMKRLEGDLGLNSSLTVDTAGEVDVSRGLTYFDLHLSEVAFWPDIKSTMKALLNTVPDEPNTMIVIESTANGRNEFHRRCKEAERGDSDYELVFIAWFEEPLYVRPFLSPTERDQFIEGIGFGDWGDDEPDLIALMREHGIGDDQIPERLNWRRWAIVNKANADLRDFHQEYPSTLDEAFQATSGQVFSSALIAKALDVAKHSPSVAGVLSPGGHETKHRRGHDIQIPVNPIWTPRSKLAGAIHTAFWDVYEYPIEPQPEATPPIPGGQYIVVVDAASGEELAQDGSAYSAIEVINHRTLEQAAEFRSRADPDVIGLQAYLAALWYRMAWLAVEVTGGYGNSMAQQHWRDWRYPRVYFRKAIQSKREKQEQRLGWQTTPQTKPMIENRMKELLRTQTSGIHSVGLCDELTSYIRDDKGRTGPEEGEYADRYMAYGIGQLIAHEKPLRTERQGTVQISTHAAAAR